MNTNLIYNIHFTSHRLMFFFINGIFCCDCDNSKEKKCGISNEWEQKSCYETHKSYLDAHRRAVHTHKRHINNVCFVYEEKTFNMMTSSAAFSLAWATFSIWNISISMSEREHMCVYCVVLWEAWKWQNFLVHKMYLFPALVRMTMGSERYSFVVSRLFAYDKRNWIFQMYFPCFYIKKKLLKHSPQERVVLTFLSSLKLAISDIFIQNEILRIMNMRREKQSLKIICDLLAWRKNPEEISNSILLAFHHFEEKR